MGKGGVVARRHKGDINHLAIQQRRAYRKLLAGVLDCGVEPYATLPRPRSPGNFGNHDKPIKRLPTDKSWVSQLLKEQKCLFNIRECLWVVILREIELAY